MSNFSCKTLDYVNPNDVGEGRKSTERVFAAATRDQFQSRSRYVQQGWAATWMLSAGHCMERRWHRPVRETQNHIQAGQTKALPPHVSLLKPSLAQALQDLGTCKPISLLWQVKQRAQRPAGRDLWGRVPVEEKVDAQEEWVGLFHYTQGASVQGGKRFNSCVCKEQ